MSSSLSLQKIKKIVSTTDIIKNANYLHNDQNERM